MRSLLWLIVAPSLVGFLGCRASAVRTPSERTDQLIPVQLSIVNESRLAVTFSLQIDGKTIVDTTVNQPRLVSGLVMSRVLPYRPGNYRIRLRDSNFGEDREVLFDLWEDPAYIFVLFRPDTSILNAGAGIVDWH